MHPLRIYTKNEQKTPDILTFWIDGVENASRSDAIFISEPNVSSKVLQRDELNVQNGENGFSGFYGMIHRPKKFEEYVRRIVNHV